MIGITDITINRYIFGYLPILYKYMVYIFLIIPIRRLNLYWNNRK